MKAFCTAFRMCLGMFTSLPLPHVKWEDSLRGQSTACLPLVGLLIGVLWRAIAAIAGAWLPPMLSAALIAAFPFLITGFIHLDGYMDTADAMLSWRDRDARLKILKDVHTGAFAVIALALLVLFQFAACASIRRSSALMLIPVLSRAASALCVLLLHPLGHSEYAGMRENAPGAPVVAVAALAVAALIALFALNGIGALCVGLAVMAAYALSMRWCVRTLGGVSGDLCGFALTLSELCGLIVLSML